MTKDPVVKLFIATLSHREKMLLEWLNKEDYSQYGECHGPALDQLIQKGLATVHAEGAHQGSFISRGRGIMYRAVSLTKAGREAAKELAQ